MSIAAPDRSDGTLLLNGAGLRWLFATLLLQHPSQLSVIRERLLFNATPRSLASSPHLASLLLRWKTANTAFVVLSFNLHVWRYSPTVTMSLISTPCTVCQSPPACMIARSLAQIRGADVEEKGC